MASGTAIELSDTETLRPAQPQVAVVVAGRSQTDSIRRDALRILWLMHSQDVAQYVIVADDRTEERPSLAPSAYFGVQCIRPPAFRLIPGNTQRTFTSVVVLLQEWDRFDYRR